MADSSKGIFVSIHYIFLTIVCSNYSIIRFSIVTQVMEVFLLVIARIPFLLCWSSKKFPKDI